MLLKCVLYNEEIGTTFLDKLGGTAVKIGEDRVFGKCCIVQLVKRV